MKTALVIDNSGQLSKEDYETADIIADVPISFIVNGEEFLEGKNMTYQQFYEFLQDPACNVSTSQPSISLVAETWRNVLKNYDEIVYILLSSGLSGACNSAINLSHEDEFEGKVFVVNNQRVSYMSKFSIFQANALIKQGKTAYEVKEYLEKTKAECGAYIAVDTLKYLKKGGRITPTAAAIGTLLNIKPILQVHGGKLDSFGKVMSMKQAKMKIIEAVRKEAEDRFPEEIKEGNVYINIAHTNPDINSIELDEFKKLVIEKFPDMKFAVMDPLPLFIACHTGPKSIAVGYAVDRLGIYDSIKN